MHFSQVITTQKKPGFLLAFPPSNHTRRNSKCEVTSFTQFIIKTTESSTNQEENQEENNDNKL